MRFWIRELLGLFLILLGLYFFFWCIDILLAEGKILEAPILAIIGVFVFRGGIHLLKVAVAARLATSIVPAPAKPIEQNKKKTTTVPLDW
jgi:hypothetical protein